MYQASSVQLLKLENPWKWGYGGKSVKLTELAVRALFGAFFDVEVEVDFGVVVICSSVGSIGRPGILLFQIKFPVIVGRN